ncbi:MAG: acyl-CoA dehydrogenase family protein [Alphaproteobacteria bacterium]|nr:acyl-CoA dehydrogenase family protein [Alphaproteobacteria bacterium]
MDFELSEQQRAFREAVGGFAARHLAEGAQARARAPGYPWDVAELMAGQGLLGITVRQADGGQGGTLMDAVLAIEAVASVCPRSADVVQAGNFAAIRTFAEYASDEQKARYLPDLLAGTALIAVAMSEPEAGSAATELRTAARPDGDGFRITGSKVFTTHGSDATLFLVYVRFGPGVGGIGSVLVERGADGFSLGEPVPYMSGEVWRQLYFEDVRVDPANVLLGPGGFKKQISAFNVERIGNAARALAVGRLAFDIAREHALERKQFGKPLAEFQGLQWKFADMALKLEAAQLLLYRAAVNADKGLPSGQETALAKVACNEAGFFAANEAMQVMGAAGYSEATLVDYCMRRTRGWMIAGGPVEILKTRIAEGVFDRRFPQRDRRPEPDDKAAE